MVATARKLFTVADLESMDDSEGWELVKGEMRNMSPASGEHGIVASRLLLRVGVFVEHHDLGEMFTAETGFVVGRDPDSVLAPGVAFVSASRLPRDGATWLSFVPFAPDLAIEIVSPSNTESEILEKIALYLRGGTAQVWLGRPKQRTLAVYSQGAPERILTIDDTLDGGDLLPGFTLALADIFRRRPSPTGGSRVGPSPPVPFPVRGRGEFGTW
ncbi:MAG: Uma2 family endonuclease [Thermomicrobiales bacterium]